MLQSFLKFAGPVQAVLGAGGAAVPAPSVPGWAAIS
jgi:hypothetical protein